MLGQPVSMLIPEVVGFKLTGRMIEGTTATDLVLKVVQMLRKKGVVSKFVEFYGEGLDHLPLADRATIANMAPEYGATCGFFPIDDETLRYLRNTGRDEARIALVEAYAKENGMWRGPDYDAGLHRHAAPRHGRDRAGDLRAEAAAGLHAAEPGGRRLLQDRRRLSRHRRLERRRGDGGRGRRRRIAAPPEVRKTATVEGEDYTIRDGSVVIAAITSCTNTSNPYVMIGAGLVARKARALGLTRKPWVKTSLAPGSQVVSRVPGGREPAGGPRRASASTSSATAAPPASATPGRSAIRRSPRRSHDNDLVATAVLSGNRNFEGRISPGRAGELPRLAAAGRRLRARRRRQHRPDHRAARRRARTARTSISRTSGRPTRRSPSWSSGR